MAEMEVWFDPSKSISKFEFLKLTFFEKKPHFYFKMSQKFNLYNGILRILLWENQGKGLENKYFQLIN